MFTPLLNLVFGNFSLNYKKKGFFIRFTYFLITLISVFFIDIFLFRVWWYKILLNQESREITFPLSIGLAFVTVFIYQVVIKRKQLTTKYKKKNLFNTIAMFIIAFFVFAGYSPHAKDPIHTIRGHSMEPTYSNLDQVITFRPQYLYGLKYLDIIKKGDVIIFIDPTQKDTDDSKRFVKRIIGLPGDTVLIENSEIVINGVILNEPYKNKDSTNQGGVAIEEGVMYEIPSNKLFVLGDNRNHSNDSRSFGFISVDTIIGIILKNNGITPK